MIKHKIRLTQPQVKSLGRAVYDIYCALQNSPSSEELDLAIKNARTGNPDVGKVIRELFNAIGYTKEKENFETSRNINSIDSDEH